MVYRASRRWEPNADQGLSSTIRQAALDAAAALGEYPTASGPRDRGRLLRDAAGALGRLDCLLTLGRELQVIDPEEGRLLEGFVTRARQLTGGLRRSWRRRGEPARAGRPPPRR